MDTEASVIADAQRITELIRAIRLRLKYATTAVIAESSLTAPQISLIETLVDADGLSLKDLSQRMGLAQSTVSGIVDRLAQRQLVQRRTNDADKRITHVYLTEHVKTFVATSPILHYPRPLIAALQRATLNERDQILDGLETLHRLIQV